MAKRQSKAFITCAITGAAHTPTMSPYLPVTPAEIARQAVAAGEAGASIVHLHARREKDGKPTGDIPTWMTILSAIKRDSNVICNMTTGGSTYMSIEDRLAAPLHALPELTSLNLGSMNFGTFLMADKYDEWLHEWEKPFLEDSKSAIFRNTFADIETLLVRLGVEKGVRFEFECYDVGHLYTLRYFVRKGLAKPPLFIQMVLGPLGGIAAEPDTLLFMKQTADRLFGDDYYFSVLAGGRVQMRLTTMAAILGGNVRVGLEDSLYIAPHQLAESNAEQVTKIRSILESLSIEIASADEVRDLLQLKGADQVGF